MSKKRLFFALWPDHRQRDRMRDFISPVAKLVEGRAIDRRNWHVTLAYIGEFPEDLIPSLLKAASKIEVEPFRLRFDKLEFWPRPKIAALTSPIVPPELQALVQQINHVLLDADIVVEERTYRPHVTVVRNLVERPRSRNGHRNKFHTQRIHKGLAAGRHRMETDQC